MAILRLLVRAIFLIIVLGAVLWLLHWLIMYLGLGEPYTKVANGILAVGGVFALIAIILDLAGVPFTDLLKRPPSE